MQEALQEKAQEQMRLYAEAQKYAVEMQQEEQKALEASRLMNEASTKAEFARQKMLRVRNISLNFHFFPDRGIILFFSIIV